VSARGDAVYALAHGFDGKRTLRYFVADRAGFQPVGWSLLPTDDNNEPAIYLQPEALLSHTGEHRVALETPAEHLSFVGPTLRHDPSDDPFVRNGGPTHLLVEDANHQHTWLWSGGAMRYAPKKGPIASHWAAPWRPTDTVDWLTPARAVLEIATVEVGGCVRWAEFDARDPEQHLRDRTAFATHPAGYSAVCLVAPGALVAVTTSNEVHWLRAIGSQLTVSASSTVGVPARVVALAARPDPNEVVAVLADGAAVQLRRP
jgi:hypothetical protein